MALATTALTLATDCLGNSSGGFTAVGPTVSVTSIGGGFTVRMGLRFQFPNLLFSAGGYVLDPPTFKSANLVLQLNDTVGPAANLYVYGVRDNQPADFTVATNLYPLAARLLSVLTDSVLGSPEYQVIPSGTVALTYVTFPLRGDLLMSCIHQVRSGVSWGGYLNLILTVDETTSNQTASFLTSDGGSAPTLNVTHEHFHTGHMISGAHVGLATRAAHSGRTGAPLWSVEAVEDGYLEGVWVDPGDYDPDDEGDHDNYRPSPWESTHDGKPIR